MNSNRIPSPLEPPLPSKSLGYALRFLPVWTLLFIAAMLAASWRADRSEGWTPGGTLTIGYAVEAPYAFVDANGEVTGESPELAKLVAAKMGVKSIAWRQVEFGSLLHELNEGTVDVVASGMFITSERLQQAAFSLPTFQVEQSLLVARNNPLGLDSYQSAAAKGARIAVIAGSYEDSLFSQLRDSHPGFTLLHAQDAASGIHLVQKGKADGFALSAPSLRWVRDKGSFGCCKKTFAKHSELAEPFFAAQGLATANGAFAFRRGDSRLLQEWNDALSSLLGSPEHQALAGRFGFDPREIPSGNSASLRNRHEYP